MSRYHKFQIADYKIEAHSHEVHKMSQEISSKGISLLDEQLQVVVTEKSLGIFLTNTYRSTKEEARK